MGSNSWREQAFGGVCRMRLMLFCPKASLLPWLPGVSDSLYAVAGWFKLPFLM